MLLLLHTIIALFIGLINASPLYKDDRIIHVNIDQWFNNKAFGANGDFDGMGTFFQQDSLLQNLDLLVDYKSIPQKEMINDNIQQSASNDIIISLQDVAIENVTLGALYMLVSSSHGSCTIDIAVTYNDATLDKTTLSLPDWQDQYTNQMERYQAIHYPLSNGNRGALFSVPIYVNPAKVPVSITIPSTNVEAAMHIFAITLYTSQSSLLVSSVRATNEWINDQHQVIQVNLHNLNVKWVQDARVRVSNSQVSTVEPGYIEAVAPGHINSVRVIVQAHSTISNGLVSVTYPSNSKTTDINAVLSLQKINQFEATSTSVQQHRSPNWLKQSKFGIFLHWGLYSVPSWAPVGKSYAEWYWWRMNHKDDAAFDYHRQHYGDNFEYDDFLAQWKPTEFDPHNWLNLVNQSRAKYFVFTTKHHDGIALFDTNVTDRSTMHLLHPNRNFVQELMDVAKKDYPQLKRGLYCK